MKFEEVLPALKKGKKIRRKEYPTGIYLSSCSGVVPFGDLLMKDWEIIGEPEPDWEYIIKHKCLCWFWDVNENNKIADILTEVVTNENNNTFFITNNTSYCNCRPVRRDEINFYEDRKDKEDD